MLQTRQSMLRDAARANALLGVDKLQGWCRAVGPIRDTVGDCFRKAICTSRFARSYRADSEAVLKLSFRRWPARRRQYPDHLAWGT